MYIYIYMCLYIYTYVYIYMLYICIYGIYCCQSLTVEDPAAVPERHCQIFLQLCPFVDNDNAGLYR